jgi:hypothetical protein
MHDITSRKLIVIKGLLFLVIIAGSSLIILLKEPTLTAGFAVCALIWASARFYYFLFYVLERYVDPGMRYSGLLALGVALLRKLRSRRGES